MSHIEKVITEYSEPKILEQKDDIWPEDITNAMDGRHSYSFAFDSLLRRAGFNCLEDCMQSYENPSWLDMFGGAYALDPDHYSHALGVRLKDIDGKLIDFIQGNGPLMDIHASRLNDPARLATLMKIIDSDKRTVLPMNAFEENSDITDYMAQRDIKGFDVVTFRPYGGFINHSPSAETNANHLYATMYMINKLYELTSNQSGRILISLIYPVNTNKSGESFGSLYKTWIDMNIERGIQIETTMDNRQIMITKTSDQPLELIW